MRRTVVVWLVVLVACVGAQENHRDAPKPHFRKFVSKVRGAAAAAAAAATTPAPPPPDPTPAPTQAPTEEAPAAEAAEAAEEHEKVAPREQQQQEERAANATDAPPSAEKLFGLPDLRTHLLAQQQRQQQLALDALRAAAQTPSFGPFQQPSVSDLQQLLRFMQQAQQGNHFSFYSPPQQQQQQQGFGFQPSYQPTPAFFAPNPAQFGLPVPPGLAPGVAAGPEQQLPYQAPATPTYVFRDGAYHVHQGGPLGPEERPRFTVATAVPSGPAAGVREPSREPPRAQPNYVSRVQFGNAVFQRPAGAQQPPPGPFQPQEPFQRPGQPPLVQQQFFAGPQQPQPPPQQQQPGFGRQPAFGQPQDFGPQQQQQPGFGPQPGFGAQGPQSFGNSRAPVFFPPQPFTAQDPQPKGGEEQAEGAERPEENLVLVSQVRGSAPAQR